MDESTDSESEFNLRFISVSHAVHSRVACVFTVMYLFCGFIRKLNMMHFAVDKSINSHRSNCRIRINSNQRQTDSRNISTEALTVLKSFFLCIRFRARARILGNSRLWNFSLLSRSTLPLFHFHPKAMQWILRSLPSSSDFMHELVQSFQSAIAMRSCEHTRAMPCKTWYIKHIHTQSA